MTRVLVTRLIPQAALDLLATRVEAFVPPDDRNLTPEELVRYSAGCPAILTIPANRIDGSFLDARPEVRLVANCAVGLDNVDLAAAKARGVVVTHTPDVLTEATANLGLALILDVTRRLSEGDRLVRRGGFKGISLFFHLGHDLAGKTLGIFGLGRIGLALARKAKFLGMEIIYHNRRPSPEAEAELKARRVGFEGLLALSDVLSINAPLTPETRGVFDYQAFRRMKPTAYLINTGRGASVVEADLARALKEGLLAGAGLDVYEREPEVHPDLLGLENVVLAPHLGSATWETREAMALTAARNVLAFVEGQEPPNRAV